MSSAADIDRDLPLPLRLPTTVLNLVLQCLTITQKFSHLTHICHRFQPLTPLDLVHDSILLSPPLIDALTASPALRLLLAGVRGLLLRDGDGDDEDERKGEAVPSSIFASQAPERWETPVLLPDRLSKLLQSFSRVQCLSLTRLVDPVPLKLLDALLLETTSAQSNSTQQQVDMVDAAPMPAPSPAVMRFPFLHTLRLTVSSYMHHPTAVGVHRNAATFRPLSLLPSLRTLVFEESLPGIDYNAMRYLCSLPLTHLDLSQVTVRPTVTLATAMEVTPVDSDERDAALLPITSTWRLVRLPTTSSAVWPSEVVMLDTVLKQYVDRIAAGGLEFLTLSTNQPHEALTRLASIRSLHSLELLLHRAPNRGVPAAAAAAAAVGESFDFAPLYSPQPLLSHLRHLRLQDHYRISRENIESGTSATLYTGLLAAYSQQLRVLNIVQVCGWDDNALLLVAVAQCSQLRVCGLEVNLAAAFRSRDPRPDREALSHHQLPAMPHLHTLRLCLPLHTNDVLAMVQLCSATLQDLSIIHSATPLSTLRTIGLKCRQLRRLECPLSTADDEPIAVTARDGDEKSQSQHKSALPLFPRLVSLSVRHSTGLGGMRGMRSSRLRQQRAAPGRHAQYYAATMRPQGVPQPLAAPIQLPPLPQAAAVANVQAVQAVQAAPQAAAAPAGANVIQPLRMVQMGAQLGFGIAPPPQPAMPQPAVGRVQRAVAMARTGPFRTMMQPQPPSNESILSLVFLLLESPLQYIELEGTLKQLQFLAPLARLQAISWPRPLRIPHPEQQQQQEQQTAAETEEAAIALLQPYFIPPTHSRYQTQPASPDHVQALMVMDEVVDDEQPVRAWQLENEARQKSQGNSSFGFFERDRVFEGGMNGREAFMAACRAIA